MSTTKDQNFFKVKFQFFQSKLFLNKKISLMVNIFYGFKNYFINRTRVKLFMRQIIKCICSDIFMRK